MKKVFLRLIVAAIIVALAAVILMNTVFKTESSVKAHEEISSYLSENGEISKLSSMLTNTDVENQAGNYIEIINAEIVTLSNLYTKIIITNKNSDSKTQTMISSVNAFEKSIKNANAKFDEIQNSNVTDPTLKSKMVKDLVVDLQNAMKCLINLNLSLVEYLIDYYYNNCYDSYIALNYIKLACINNYFNATDDEYKANYFKQYNALITACNDMGAFKEEISSCNFNTELLYNAKVVNIYKLMTEGEGYLSTLKDEKLTKAQAMKGYINVTLLPKLCGEEVDNE